MIVGYGNIIASVVNDIDSGYWWGAGLVIDKRLKDLAKDLNVAFIEAGRDFFQYGLMQGPVDLTSDEKNTITACSESINFVGYDIYNFDYDTLLTHTYSKYVKAYEENNVYPYRPIVPARLSVKPSVHTFNGIDLDSLVDDFYPRLAFRTRYGILPRS